MNIKEKKDYVDNLAIQMVANILSQFSKDEDNNVPFPISLEEIVEDNNGDITSILEALTCASCSVFARLTQKEMNFIEVLGLMNLLLFHKIIRDTKVHAGVIEEDD